MTDRLHETPEGQSPDPALERQLEARGARARIRPGLVSGIFERSVEHLPAPKAIPFQAHETSRRPAWIGIAAAACVLLACAVTARLLFSVGGGVAPNESQDRQIATSTIGVSEGYDEAFPSDRDTVLVALLDASSSGRIEAVEYLEGSDAVGAAFAPILGTTGFGMDDFAMEIRSIEGALGR